MLCLRERVRHFLSRKQFLFERRRASECSQQNNNQTYLPVILRKLQLPPRSITECDKIRRALLCLRPAKHVWIQLTLSASHKKKQIEVSNQNSRESYRHSIKEKMATFSLWFRSETTASHNFMFYVSLMSFRLVCHTDIVVLLRAKHSESL